MTNWIASLLIGAALEAMWMTWGRRGPANRKGKMKMDRVAFLAGSITAKLACAFLMAVL